MGFGRIQAIPKKSQTVTKESQTVVEEAVVVQDINGGIDVEPRDRIIDMDNPTSGNDHLRRMDEVAEKYENSIPDLTMVPIPESVEVPSSRTVDDREVDNVPEQSR